jgi:hypothetical protein
MLQLPYGVISIMGSVFLKDQIEVNSLWERDLELLEELEEKEKEIEYRQDWLRLSQNSLTEEHLPVNSVWTKLFFPRGCGILPDIPPEFYFSC